MFIGFSGIAHATNGDNLIGVTPASRGMGGIGVGMPVGSTDSIFRNPAWMSNYNGFNASLGGVLFLPNVKGRFYHPMMGDSGYVTSDADTFVVPEIGVTQSINDKLSFGMGAFGVSGMGVDYKNKDSRLSGMHTTFQFMRLIPALSYKVSNDVAIAGALHLAYGSLDMGATMQNSMTGATWNAGGGQSQDLGIGAQVGIAYDMRKSVFLGLTYQTPVSMKYKKVFDSDGDGNYEDLKLQQPQELAFGIGFKPVEKLKLGLDVRWIDWSGADGYGDFKWRDQWVFGIGSEYKPIPELALRIGWNYGKTPIRGESNLSTTNANTIPDFVAPFSDFSIAWFNLMGFPAITEHHLTLGVGYEFTKHFGVDLAYKHAFNKTVESDTGAGGAVVGAKNAQDALAFALNWKF